MNSHWQPEKIGDHGMISDGETAALVHRDGTIDWLCMPRYDSQACLAALLGDGENGAWWMHPQAEVTASRRCYQGDTLILETCFETAEGEVAVIDFMPVRRGQAPDIVRIVEGRRGAVPMCSELALRFDYGRTHPLVRSLSETEVTATAGPNAVALRCDVPIDHSGRCFSSRFTVKEGERRAFVMTWFPSHADLPDRVDPERALDQARAYWEEWSSRCRYDGPHRDMVMRSLLTLKALIHAETGGMVAAATAGLPEQPGGKRNWDYRFCWLRDATFTLLAFVHSGYDEEARQWIGWLQRATGGEPIDVQPFYTIDGGRESHEWDAQWLNGFGGAQPVRLGNGAVNQCQLDVYGEVLDAIYAADRSGVSRDGGPLVPLLAEKLEGAWHDRDAGIWESRGHPLHHTYSKAMCWVAFDRAARLMEDRDPDKSRRWRGLADAVREEVLEKGFDTERNAFTQAYGNKALDGAVLRLPLVGFIDPCDPRMVATVEAIEQELIENGYVYRYSADATDDGVGGKEGAFVAVCCWLADVYALQGRRDDALAMLQRVRDAANDLCLLSEEVWPADSRLLGNFPQALSHLSFVNSALNVATANGPAKQRAG